MRGMFKEMARQWKEKGNVSGRFYGPEAGVEFGTNCHPSIYINNAQRQSKPGTRLLPIDVIDSWAISRVDEEFRGSCYTLYADVPGLSKADLSIRLSKERVLTISGERILHVKADMFPKQQERVMGSFERRWQLPWDAESEGISAKVTDGALTITVPKKKLKPGLVNEQQDISIAF